jgi:hypothetical protein
MGLEGLGNIRVGSEIEVELEKGGLSELRGQEVALNYR